MAERLITRRRTLAVLGGTGAGLAVGASAGNRTAAASAAQSPYLLASNNLSDVDDAGSSQYDLHIPVLTACAALAASNVAGLAGLQTIDGYTLQAGASPDQVLLTAQTTASQNGPWVVSSGAWKRPTSYPSGGSVGARTVAIIQGTVYGGSLWLLKTDVSITVDTTSTTWANQTRQLAAAGYLIVTDLTDAGESSNLEFYLRPRTAGGIGFPVPAFYPATSDSPIALDLIPNGPVNYACTDGGVTHLDVCSADCLTTDAATTVARVGNLRPIDDGAGGHVEFSSHDYSAVANPDVWVNPGSAGSVTVPQILLHRPTKAAGTVTLGGDGSDVIVATPNGPAQKLLLPLANKSLSWPSTMAAGSGNLWIARQEAPRTGTLAKLAILISASSGHHCLVICDTGDSHPGKRTVLWSSGSTVVASSGWQVFSPGLAITAGVHYEIGVVADNNSVAYARPYPDAGNAGGELPSGFLTVPGGANPFVLALVTNQAVGGLPVGTQIAESSYSATQVCFAIIGQFA